MSSENNSKPGNAKPQHEPESKPQTSKSQGQIAESKPDQEQEQPPPGFYPMSPDERAHREAMGVSPIPKWSKYPPPQPKAPWIDILPREAAQRMAEDERKLAWEALTLQRRSPEDARRNGRVRELATFGGQPADEDSDDDSDDSYGEDLPVYEETHGEGCGCTWCELGTRKRS